MTDQIRSIFLDEPSNFDMCLGSCQNFDQIFQLTGDRRGYRIATCWKKEVKNKFLIEVLGVSRRIKSDDYNNNYVKNTRHIALYSHVKRSQEKNYNLR